ncbi:MAG: hypothetical protein L0Z51_08235 [Candidatus Latescibacteria bacterium]|nr:hypothetical protein [Candidatus Latescibacterota bacterium]
MPEELVDLKIADQNAAIRYLGEMQSRAMDPIHEPIQNLFDEGATRIEIELDPRKHQVRIRGDAKPIVSTTEARRILQSICASQKRNKLGEKGVGMLSFVTVAESMTTVSQKSGRVVWFKLERENLERGRVGADARNRLPYAGTEIVLKGINPRNMKYRFGQDRVVKDVKRRWGPFLSTGKRILVNGRDVTTIDEPLKGDIFQRRIEVPEIGKEACIDVLLIVVKEPSDLASVSVTHRGQANFLMSDVPLFEGINAFTQGMVHGTISGDIAPLNANRSGFKESEAFDAWAERVIDLEDELARMIEERAQSAAEQRYAAMLKDWMEHLKRVFSGSELASARASAGEGDEEGWPEPPGEGEGGGGDGTAAPAVVTPRKGGGGRMPTVPYAGFTKAPPGIRVVRERRAFRINVNHPDYVRSARNPRDLKRYLQEVCMHEAYLYSLDGKKRELFQECEDEFLGYWTRAFMSAERKG